VRLWDVPGRGCLAVLEDHTDRVWGVAFSPDGKHCYSSAENGVLRAWSICSPAQRKTQPQATSLYTNAKVLLVGDSAVGKTGLAFRLAKDEFKESHSTDGTWATQLPLPHASQSNRVEREIWVWDFAGQSDYRLIHQLFMDEAALAVLVFNPQSENPFEGLAQWNRDLHRAARGAFTKLLVAGRCDRGGTMVSRASIDRFREEKGYADYLETSAKLGTNCDALREAIEKHIPWEGIPQTASPQIFRRLKEEIVKLRDEGKVLLRLGELKQQLELRLPTERFSLEELNTVVGLLAGPGLVWRLEFGGFILLQPERINAYAAAVIRKVRRHTDEIGCIHEQALLEADLDYQDLDRLPPDEEQIVL
jgi:small GTP-binding protein